MNGSQVAEASTAFPQHAPVSAGPRQRPLESNGRLIGDDGSVLRRRRFCNAKRAILGASQTAEKEWSKPGKAFKDTSVRTGHFDTCIELRLERQYRVRWKVSPVNAFDSDALVSNALDSNGLARMV
jgi:hypothetical protein